MSVIYCFFSNKRLNTFYDIILIVSINSNKSDIGNGVDYG